MPNTPRRDQPDRTTSTSAAAEDYTTPLRDPLLPGEAGLPLLDEDGWPILENASTPDLIRAAQAVGGLAHYGNFLRAALAGIYAERRLTMRLREHADGCELHWGSCDE